MSLPDDFIAELRKHFTGDIRCDPTTRLLYSTDASIYQVEPLGVALPRTQDDLQAAVELAARYRIPILPRGSGSSLAGQAIGEALILDCSRWLDKIIEIDREARTATVEPGVILGTLNRQAAWHDLQYGPDPASAERASMGGVIANNATGAHSIVYGMTADHIQSAQVILTDGSLAEFSYIGKKDALRVATNEQGILSNFYRTALQIREQHAKTICTHWPITWRNSAGYRLNYLLPWSATQPPQWEGTYPNVPPGGLNMAALLAGSEGTLAVIRQATLHLVHKPKHTVLGVLPFDSLEAACDATPELLTRQPAAVELIPQKIIQLARAVPAYARLADFVTGDPEALLVVEFAGDDPKTLLKKGRALGSDVMVAESPEEQVRVWGVRKVGLGLLMSQPVDLRPAAFIEDCAIPVEHLGEFVRRTERILLAHNTQAAFYAHASGGCLHIRPLIDLKVATGVRDLRSIAEAVLALSLSLGGSMSSEHGDGLSRSEWLTRIYGEELVEAFRSLKRAADPEGILNPGKIVDPLAMDSNLRYGPGYEAQTWTPALDFGRNGGLGTAIEQCNGAGVCRKLDEGVMCPSFQATREELHSTRGRANLLRAMISLPRSLSLSQQERGWDKGDLSRAVYAALDLCLACKGCKAECPSGVDMAKLKYEFLAQYHLSHRRPLRDYLFAYIGKWARLGALFAGAYNALSGNRLLRKLLESSLGITAKRPLPTFDTRKRDKKRSPWLPSKQSDEFCLYLPDAFTHYFEPDVEKAALHVLAACGVGIKVLPVLGTGRTMISKGFLKAAKRQATQVLDSIQRLDPSGRLPVVGVEPSEIYTVRDEYLDLLPNRSPEIEALASRTWLVDEFLVRPIEKPGKSSKLRVANILNLNISKTITKIKLHGHCYQKAQSLASNDHPTGVDASAQLLRLAGYDVEVLNAGCCGVAGAFGYETEHYELSKQVGELRLLPAIRAWRDQSKEGLVAAPGTSCRAQILDGTGVKTLHPIEAVAARLNIQ
jgi:FAD/FMN-containing dehydrogenase/Fe-S oxidoreductase